MHSVKGLPPGHLRARDELRAARAKALEDAEGFQEVLFAIERLGTLVSRKIGPLESYREKLLSLISQAKSSSAPDPYHMPGGVLFSEVVQARNDALHHGAYARNLTSHAVHLALTLEDALMDEARLVAHFMVTSVVSAHSWQPLSFVRREMLANSYSFLPYLDETKRPAAWRILADVDVARALRGILPGERKSRLAMTLAEALAAGHVRSREARIVGPAEDVAEVLAAMGDLPILVCEGDAPGRLVGLLTAFDVL